jgi:hypothetical protein
MQGARDAIAEGRYDSYAASVTAGERDE